MHGGAFIRGDKNGPEGLYDNVLYWFARQGFVGVNVEYRLAPESVHPGGADDVAAAIRWAHGNVHRFGGDPDRLLLIGHSAGGTHVASFAFDPGLPHRGAHAAAIVLISARLRADTLPENPNAAGVAAYFGTDPAAYGPCSPVAHGDGSGLPTMIVIAEHENPLLDLYGLEMAHAIAVARRRAPRILTMPGHNHLSIVAHFNTAEERLGRAIIDFLESAGIHPRFGGRVLDFGCGLGRLTNALGRRFDTAVGVDISPTMVDRAQAQAPAGVSFVVNRSDDLSQFDDSSFDFVYSNIVLQHVSNELQRAYLAEFCRVLTPGGLAVIQLPSLRRGLKGTVKRLLPPKLAASMRRYLRPSRLLRRDDYVIHMEMNCLPENDVWRIVEGAGCVVAHCAFSNAAKADFGGNLIFTGRDEAYANAAGGGFVSPVYVIRRPYE